jgi:hypothetical protein
MDDDIAMTDVWFEAVPALEKPSNISNFSTMGSEAISSTVMEGIIQVGEVIAGKDEELALLRREKEDMEAHIREELKRKFDAELANAICPEREKRQKTGEQ